TDVTGTVRLGNGIKSPLSTGAYGVEIVGGASFHTVGASNNIVGGTAPGARNIISGNVSSGVRIRSNASGNFVQGNYIGTDVTGTRALGNGYGVDINGSSSDNTGSNIIGGTIAGTRNIISGNSVDGIIIGDGNTIGNVVQGNYIGTDVTGNVALGNGQNGVESAHLSSGTLIGGTVTGAGNVISGNGANGVLLTGITTGDLIQGNYIGTNATGTAILGNTRTGVLLGSSAASGNTIGGTNPGARNVIA